MKKLSNYQKLKNQFVIIVEEYNNTVLPYQLAINNIDTQYKAITNVLEILEKQRKLKRHELHEVLKNKHSFFKNEKFKQYGAGCSIFIDNSDKLYHEYNNILAYLSLKKIIH